jgi:hypothetical protein
MRHLIPKCRTQIPQDASTGFGVESGKIGPERSVEVLMPEARAAHSGAWL